MTETISRPSKKALVEVDIDEKRPYTNATKKTVLNYIFRNVPFTRANKITLLSLDKYRGIRNALNTPISTIRKVFNTFVVDLIHFKMFQHKFPIGAGLKSPVRKTQVYLRKIYRIAPVFDYKRAKFNAKSLAKILDRINYWPQIMTQVAVTLFITEFNRSKLNQEYNPISQNKICILCDCSPYAFHRCRNKIGLDRLLS